MKNSDILKLFAKANEKCGYFGYAKKLEKSAVVEEAKEILQESEGKK